MDEDLVSKELGGDENFLEQAQAWKPDKHAPVRERVAGTIQQLSKLPDRRPKGKKSGTSGGQASAAAAPATPIPETERW
ncbi:hypothetical protein EO238_29840, partial [Citrobacter sp. AAK_AS5]